jgi:integrase
VPGITGFLGGDAMADLTQAKRKSKTDRDFPLWLHPSGRWCRKVDGKWYYFGRDKEAALVQWLQDKDSIFAGRGRPVKTDAITVAALCNEFLTSKRHLVDTRELALRTWHSYFKSCEKLVAALGGSRPVVSLTPLDFQTLRSTLAKGRGPVTLRGEVLNIRTLFKYGTKNELLDKPVRYGDGFGIPPKAVLRRARQERDGQHGKRMFQPDELRSAIDKAAQPLRAMVLLGINCAFGATDLSSMPESTLDLKGGWVTFPRPKTAIERRCPLWPETAAALREAMKDRKEPKLPEDAGLVFLTRCRQRWVRVGTGGSVIDAVACEFAKVLKELGIKRPRLGFYALRHTFRTIADEVRDDPATDRIMGHTDGSVGAGYVEHIDDARLKQVTAHVRKWLFAKRKK